jgi:curli production assembly/transport component CsgG|tara:strand:- start:760 stop:1512 length:753 start_codon:yes stop_codon:yes gene_type:complete
VILLFSLGGCSTYERRDFSTSTTLPMVSKLEKIRPPERKVELAIYAFNDQTGQRKPADNLASLSTAITQGAGTWLVQAFKNAGKGQWFTVVERMQLDNLLKERQIIRNTRSTYEGDDAQQAPPLLFAGVLAAGGVVGYDTNIETGGIGARALGIGIHDEYRRDMVSVSLRIISVQTGEVLIAVSSQKTILSTKIGMNVFKFVDMGTKLVEIEGGSAKNESTTYAVRKAIEQAVVLVIEEGIDKKYWKYKR